MLLDQFPEAESLIQIAHQDQTAVGGDPRTLKIDPQRRVEGKLKRTVLFLTDEVSPSKAPLLY